MMTENTENKEGQIAQLKRGDVAPVQESFPNGDNGRTKAATDTERTIYEAPLAGGDRLRVRIVPYGGRLYLDCQKWYVGADGGLYPTKQGWRVNAEMADQLATALAGVATLDSD